MSKKITGFVLAAVLTAMGFPAAAQQRKNIPRIGWLAVSFKSVLPERYAAFQQGLCELGYVEGRNIVIVRSDAGGKLDKLADAATELVRLKVEVIVTSGATGLSPPSRPLERSPSS
ncbi:MAG TPA: hypothetical protein VGH16_20705 [Candidatus Binatia bacterium]|jgi:putative ABC transport system substrate-binding protein